MIKKALKDLAQRLYIRDGCSLESIAANNNIPLRTLQLWCSNHGWREAREEYLESSFNFVDEMYSFAVQTAKDIRSEWVDKKKIDSGKLKLLDTILGKVVNVIKIEDERQKNRKNARVTEDLPEEVRMNPEVRKAMAVIASVLEKYKNKDKK